MNNSGALFYLHLHKPFSNITGSDVAETKDASERMGIIALLK